MSLYVRQILLLPMSSHYHTFFLFYFTCKKMKEITEGNEFIGCRKQMFKKEIAIYQTTKQLTLIIAFFFLAITCTIFNVNVLNSACGLIVFRKELTSASQSHLQKSKPDNLSAGSVVDVWMNEQTLSTQTSGN